MQKKLLTYLLMCRPQVQPISVHFKRAIKKKQKKNTQPVKCPVTSSNLCGSLVFVCPGY